ENNGDLTFNTLVGRAVNEVRRAAPGEGLLHHQGRGRVEGGLVPSTLSETQADLVHRPSHERVEGQIAVVLEVRRVKATRLEVVASDAAGRGLILGVRIPHRER